MELNVLARRDVSPTTRELGGKFTHKFHLLGRDGAGGQLNAHHLIGSALALTVHAIVETHHAENVFANFSRKVLANGDFEALDVAHLLGVKITGLRGWCNCHHGSYLENRPISQSLVSDRRPRLLHVTHH